MRKAEKRLHIKYIEADNALDYSRLDEYKFNEKYDKFCEISKCIINTNKRFAARLIHNSEEFKFVETAKNIPVYEYEYQKRLPPDQIEYEHENWAPNWIIDGRECFILIRQKYKTDPKNFNSDNLYRLYAAGLDDFAISIENLTESQSKELFDLIMDNTTKQDLYNLGFKY